MNRMHSNRIFYSRIE